MTNWVSTSNRSDTIVLWLTYLLYLSFAPALVGLGINYFASKSQEKIPRRFPVWSEKREVILSHHQWLMRTFIFVSVFVMVGFGTAYLGIGYAIAAAAIVWWFYRVIKGMVAFANHRRMPA